MPVRIKGPGCVDRRDNVHVMANQTHQCAIRDVRAIALGKYVLVPEDQFIKVVLDCIGCNFVASNLHCWAVE